MDPQSQTFTPYSTNNDTWRMQSEVVRLQQIQGEHADRIARLERRQDEDARVKSVWGNSSPFPSVLSGTPQQVPVQQPSSDNFRNFDDEANNLMSSLHLDAEEEPRRAMGAASRANSVRFDESANQNHFSHLTRPSFDYLSRTSSSISGIGLGERAASHKSDGRASSAHSIRSAASGRANSLNLDTSYGVADSSRSSQDLPSIAPGLLLLGTVPAIIRCWMNLNFKHDALLYAAVCTGSYRSYLHEDLVRKLGFEDIIKGNEDGLRTIELPVYFPEAVPHPASSRPTSPAPQLPAVTVQFDLIESSKATATNDNKSIQIFLGSDTLRLHNADILFSSNSMTLYDDDRGKLSIPLVRPENESVFNMLRVTGDLDDVDLKSTEADFDRQQPHVNGAAISPESAQDHVHAASASSNKYRPPVPAVSEAIPSQDSAMTRSGAMSSDHDTRPVTPASSSSRPSLVIAARNENHDFDPSGLHNIASATSQRSANGSPAVWSNWRRETSSNNNIAPTSAAASTTSAAASSSGTGTGLDWANASKAREASYQRKETGIKVLKPKSASRTFSSSTATTPVATTANAGENKTSRYFDEGRRKSGGVDTKTLQSEKKEEPAAFPSSKTRPNAIGGGAFSWLNSSNTESK